MEFDRKTVLQIGNILIPIVSGLLIAISTIGVDVSGVFADDGSYPKLLNPAPFTFAIWGPILIFLGLFWYYQGRDILKKPEEKIDMPYVHEVSVFFILSTLATSFWYILWAYDYIWPAIAAMWLYLIFNLLAYLRLGINKRERSIREHIFVTISWSMLSAWITVATIVNTTTGLVYSGFNPAPLGEVGWTILVLLIALVIYLLVLITRNDFVFALVGLWAIIGVIATRIDPAEAQVPEVTNTALLGAILLSAAIVVWFIFQQKREEITFLSKIRNG